MGPSTTSPSSAAIPQVTIFGESAGGISVSMLTVAPAAKGLFRGTISRIRRLHGPQHDHRPARGPENVPSLALAEKKGLGLLHPRNRRRRRSRAARTLSADAISRGGGGTGGAPASGPSPTAPPSPGATQYELFQAGKFNDTASRCWRGRTSDERDCRCFVCDQPPTPENFDKPASVARFRAGG